MIAGGIAGSTVDFLLFPLDSIKTRIQHAGVHAKLSLQRPYAGLSSAIIASFPCAATFWGTYSLSKHLFELSGFEPVPAVKHVISAACGSVATCLVRNPFEVVKQQMQVG
jgi:solute carrier family 25 S-adenosylmethionine transporter 26